MRAKIPPCGCSTQTSLEKMRRASWSVILKSPRSRPGYVGKLAPEEIAEILAKACGHWGSGAEYLFNTVCKLEERGIHDRYLWQLQRLVADRIVSDQRLLQRP